MGVNQNNADQSRVELENQDFAQKSPVDQDNQNTFGKLPENVMSLPESNEQSEGIEQLQNPRENTVTEIDNTQQGYEREQNMNMPIHDSNQKLDPGFDFEN